MLNLRNFFKKSSVLGIDVSRSTIKIVELSYVKENYHVLNYDMSTFIENDEENLVAVLIDMLSRTKFSSKTAISLVPDQITFRQEIKISKNLTEKEIMQVAYMEVCRSMPGIPLNIDFQVVNQIDNNSDLLDINIIATRSDWINKRVDCFNKCGLKIQVIEPKSYAIRRFIAHYIPSNLIIALLYFDGLDIGLYITHNNQLIFEQESQNVNQDLLIFINNTTQLFYLRHPSKKIDFWFFSGPNNLSCMTNLSFHNDHFLQNTQINSEFIIAYGLAMSGIRT